MQPNLDIEIVHQTPADVEEVTNVFYQAWLETYPNVEQGITVEDIEYLYKDSFSEEAMQKRRDHIRSLPNDQLSLVAKHSGKIVGVCGVTRGEAMNKLRTIYVLPEYHGKGVGYALWIEAEKFFDATKDSFVEVADYNEKAINFYKKLGFEDTGKRSQDERFRMKSGAIITEMEMKRKADTQK